MGLDGVNLIDIREFHDNRGGMSFLENEELPFDIKRIFYIYDVPKKSMRGGHAHIEHLTILIAINGSFTVQMEDNKSTKMTVKLNKPNMGLFIPNMIWHEVTDFTKNAVCLVLASDIHKEEDYIRDFETFKNS